MADRNAPVGANLARLGRDVREFYGAEGERPAAGGAYAMTAEEEREEAARFMRELQARRAARAAERAAAPSMITNRPVGGNLAAAQPQRTRMTDAAEQPAMPSQRGALTGIATAAARQGGVGSRQMRMQDPEGTEEVASARQQPAERPRQQAPRRRQPQGMSEADRLNEISLAFARGERPRGGAAETIGKALGVEGYKKGGLIGKRKAAAKVVKKAAGGAIQKPKVPGRPAGRPAQNLVKPMGTRGAAKAAKPMKPVAMPAFKKGGKVAAKKRK